MNSSVTSHYVGGMGVIMTSFCNVLSYCFSITYFLNDP